MFNWHKKESPILSMLGIGGGIGSKLIGGAAGFSASGGNIADGVAPGNGYKYHTFGAPGNFVADADGTIDLLVIGGGGTGHGFGGGGAGAVVHVTDYSLSAGTYPVTIGDGDILPAGAAPSTDQLARINGDDTTFHTIVTAGGGGASQEILYPNIAGQPGGSGGGGDGSNSPGDPGGSAVNPGNLGGGTYYGNAGGSGGPRADGGGGGGAGGAGTPDGGAGGAGYPFPTFAYPLCFPAPYLPGFATPTNPISGYTPSPTSDHYGGGGGGSQAESATPRAGGAGGGGASSFAPALNQSYPSPTRSGKDGLEYLGAGGGGGQTQSGVGGNPGGQGGKGVVIIRYLAS
jgi:hypothetical protein